MPCRVPNQGQIPTGLIDGRHGPPHRREVPFLGDLGRLQTLSLPGKSGAACTISLPSPAPCPLHLAVPGFSQPSARNQHRQIKAA